MTAAPAALSLFYGLGSPADDPAIVGVWSARFDRIVAAEREQDARTRRVLYDAFLPAALAARTLNNPPEAR